MYQLQSMDIHTMLLMVLGCIATGSGTNISMCSDPAWTVTFEDNFDFFDDKNWVALNNVTHGPTEKQLYLSENVRVADGDLIISTKKQIAWYNSNTRYNFTSGWIESKSKR